MEQPTKNIAEPFSPYQILVIALLALLQFTIVLDFMVLAPLGDYLMKSLSMTPKGFGLVVSSYAFSAGLSGILAAGFADKFDRKKLLLFFYTGSICIRGCVHTISIIEKATTEIDTTRAVIIHNDHTVLFQLCPQVMFPHFTNLARFQVN